jgi:predicted O-methyltransferase YrrM
MRKTENPLASHFRNNRGHLIHKWLHYFDIYDRHFAPYRGRPVTVLEFGVFHGGSLQMWKKYFGRKARIIGVDINPECAKLTERQIEVVIGNQEDRDFLRDLRERIGPIDVVIEDGGHKMTQQINTFEEIWPGVRDGGVFLIEDLHTSYWQSYGGGYKRAGTFVEYAKDLVDQVNAWHSHDEQVLSVDDYTRSIRGMHVYDSIIVFDKGQVVPPMHEQTGTPTLTAEPAKAQAAR